MRKRKRSSFNKLVYILLFVFTSLLLSQVALAKTPITLDKKGRAGCLACHGDPKLHKVENSKKISLYIDPDRFYASVHKDRACLDCHTDWGFRTHKVKGGDYKKTAGLACIRCHKHQKQYKEYRDSVHSRIAMGKAKHSGKEAKGKDGATCGSCHNALEPRGIHYIEEEYPKDKKDKDGKVIEKKTWKNSEYWTEFRYAADKVCGQCHMDRYKSYNDYYHGRAYKTKEVDAPTCWDCHNNHDVFRKEEMRSSITEENLSKTCGRCHPEPSKSFTGQYAEMIHGRHKLYEKNVVLRLYRDGFSITGKGNSIKNVYNTVLDWGRSIIRFFFPQSLRPQNEAKKD